jgi:fibrillarin-like pre-rRNA processing protein
MQPSVYPGVFQRGEKLYTVNPVSCHGVAVYGEYLVAEDEVEYRSWNPYRSKLAASLLKRLPVSFARSASVLYLGAATGTTVSHVSDIVSEGVVYAVEKAPLAMAKLLRVSERRGNVIPILEDAAHPDRYASMVPSVDVVYQDIAQRNQAEIFLVNLERFLKPGGLGVLMVKARSIDVALAPKQAYLQVGQSLQQKGVVVEKTMELGPYDKDHAVFLVRLPG